MRVLERIRQQLLNDKAEPFFIGEHTCPRLLVVQCDLLADKMSRIAADRHPDHSVEICLPQHKVRGLRSETHIRKRHVHILLNRKQLLQFFSPALLPLLLQPFPVLSQRILFTGNIHFLLD